MIRQHWFRQYLGAICVVGAMTGGAVAEDLQEDKLILEQPASHAGDANRQKTSCGDAERCKLSPENARARAAMALLYFGINDNCGKRSCALRLAAGR
ncbi:MAG: hypothetical protein IID51_00170 [Proteobacteria bacterium]|nr:hypothetical protein [Pseudomonadota bacterium]